ncbi:MAG: hypothetical protein ABJA32_05145 [Ginsengibacter sp.]
MSTFLMGAMAVISMYEALFLMPKYFSNPPLTFALWRENSEVTSKVFWTPLQIGVLVTLIVSMIFNWKYPKRRQRLIAVMSIYLAVWAVSLAYFVPHVKEFIAMPSSTVITDDICKTINTWRSLTWFRQVALLGCYIGMLIALAIPATTEKVINI